ncbi:MAG: Spy/CpxP family protein refolding chaperone [Smithella sp.]
MKKLILTTVVIMSILLAVTAFAFGPNEGNCSCNEKGSCYHNDAVWKKLNLSDEQKAKIEVIRTSTGKELRPIREKMFDKSVELRRLWLQANPDKDKITAAQKEMRKLRDLKDDKVTAMKLEIRKVLTPEQNEKLANSHWDRGPGFGPRGGNRSQNVFCPGGYF